MTRHIALATCAALPDGDPEDQLLAEALRRRGARVDILDWAAQSVDWSAPDAVVLRSTWDYTARRADFLAWARSIRRLYNPVDVIAANTDKTYLAGLTDAGLAAVPTFFAAPGEPVVLPAAGEYVVKPSVGAGSRGVGRFDAAVPAAADHALSHAAALHAADRTVMVQPYQSAVDTAGETALIFIDGQFSHSIRKGPMLAPATRHPVHGASLYIEENISVRTPSAAELELAGNVVTHLGAGGEPLLYARIDLLPGADGPVVIEVELTEPSLFLGYADGAADRLADALLERAGSW